MAVIFRRYRRFLWEKNRVQIFTRRTDHELAHLSPIYPIGQNASKDIWLTDQEGRKASRSICPTHRIWEKSSKDICSTDQEGKKKSRSVCPTYRIGEKSSKDVCPTDQEGEKASRSVCPTYRIWEKSSKDICPTDQDGKNIKIHMSDISHWPKVIQRHMPHRSRGKKSSRSTMSHSSVGT